MAESNQPIVIDNGTGAIKAGFAGGDKPKAIFRSCVGIPKHTRVMPGGALESADVILGSKIDEHRGALRIQYAIENGVVQNWADMEKLWSYVYSRENLNVPSEQHAVLITEAPLNPFRNREKMAEFFFEGLNIPALFFSIQAILSLYASGRTTGVVLDSGDGVTHIVPVYEGYCISNAMKRIDIAGREVTNHLHTLLRRSGTIFRTSGELEIVRQIKEKCCRIAFNPVEEEQKKNQVGNYLLPDGTNIDVGHESFRAPEILFQPSLIGCEDRGVHDLLVGSILSADIDLRRILYSQIVVAGGNTMLAGFGERLLNELRKHNKTPKETKIRIAAPPERLYSTWIGGSILASLATFKSIWISKNDYSEYGASVLTKHM